MSFNVKSAFAMASAAAALFAMTAPLTTAHAGDDTSVKCSGVNSCKGTSDCKTAKSGCKGQNSCKGEGWNKKASSKECTDAGGTVVK